jgi:hypothetical protein
MSDKSAQRSADELQDLILLESHVVDASPSELRRCQVATVPSHSLETSVYMALHLAALYERCFLILPSVCLYGQPDVPKYTSLVHALADNSTEKRLCNSYSTQTRR